MSVVDRSKRNIIQRRLAWQQTSRGAIRLPDPDQDSQFNLGSDSLGKSNDLGVSWIHFGFGFIVNPDPGPIFE